MWAILTTFWIRPASKQAFQQQIRQRVPQIRGARMPLPLKSRVGLTPLARASRQALTSAMTALTTSSS
jgi:hypothetical protein